MSKDIDFIGVPLELGADRKGISKGPAAIRNAGAIIQLASIGHNVIDKGDLTVSAHPQRNPAKLKHLHAIHQLNQDLCESVYESVVMGHLPLVIGGDHSIAIGTLAGVAAHVQHIGVIWIDAHGDMNTHKTTPSGNIHGMSMAASMGFGHPKLTSIGGRIPKVNPKHAVLIGVRSLDPGERTFIRKHGIQIYTVNDIRRMGMDKVMEHAIEIASNGTQGIHVSFDLDVLDPTLAPGVSTPVSDGLTIEEAVLAVERVRRSVQLISAEFVELNPDLDLNHMTASIASELIASLIGPVHDSK